MSRFKLSILSVSVVALIAVGAVLWNFLMPSAGPTVTLPGISYSVAESSVGVLLDSSDTRDVLETHIPGIADIRQLSVARPLTLPDIQPYYPEMITDERLAALDLALGDIESSSVVVYTTSSTLVGVLLDDPEAIAIVDKYLPGFSTNPDIDQGRGFTLSFMQKFDRKTITDEKLASMDAEFEALAKQRAGL